MNIIDYKLKLNGQSFSKNKRNIIILIRRSPGELDWIMPLLYSLRNKYNIFTIFRNAKTINLLKNDKILFALWNKTSFGYTVEPKLNSIIFRVGYFLFKRTILGDFFKFKFQDNYYNASKIKNLIQDQTKTKYNFIPEAIFAEFINFSPWINCFYNQNQLIKIIHFPHTSNIFGEKKLKIKNINKIKNRYLLLSNSYDVRHFQNKFLNSNIIEAGYLKYEKSWVKNYLVKKIKKTKKIKKIIYISYRGYNSSVMQLDKYVEQTIDIMDICTKIPNTMILFKIHPMTDRTELLKILNLYSKKKWKLVNDSQIYLAKICDVYIAMFSTAAIMDGLGLKKTPIELWNIFNEKNGKIRKSKFQSLNISLFVRNRSELKNEIIHLLKLNRFDKRQFKIFQKFNKNFFINGSISYTKKIIGL